MDWEGLDLLRGEDARRRRAPAILVSGRPPAKQEREKEQCFTKFRATHVD